ncbi:hypothetical protein ACTHTH_11335, partial [Neisseria sp. P0017.S008]|uniref:hypothetical protein n=1 Tax=Neisseria sp. P0017.S008 TaxID=3436784 RepID=UPI003F7D42A1
PQKISKYKNTIRNKTTPHVTSYRFEKALLTIWQPPAKTNAKKQKILKKKYLQNKLQKINPLVKVKKPIVQIKKHRQKQKQL